MNQFESNHEKSILDSLVQRAGQGSSDAEAEIHRAFVDRLVRLASQRINQRFQAKIDPEEVVQSVFVSFFQRNAAGAFQFDDWNDLWCLLVKITVRKCSTRVSGFMTAKRDVSVERSPKSKTDGSSMVLRSPDPNPQEIAIFNESLDQLFDLLTPLQQEIVTLRLQGCSKVEISQKIGRTERTIYRSLNQVQSAFENLQ